MKMSDISSRQLYASKVSSTMCDILLLAVEIALKDPTVMGKKNAFGAKREREFMRVVMENYNEMVPAFWYKNPDRVYTQYKIVRKFHEMYPNDPLKTFEMMFPFSDDIKDYTPDYIEFRNKEDAQK